MNVEERIIEDVLVSGIKTRDKFTEMGKYFTELAEKLGDNIAGPSLCIYLSEPEEGASDYEVCFPVKEKREIQGVDTRVLKGGKAVVYTHKGSYTGLAKAWEEFMGYFYRNGYVPTNAPREVYVECFTVTENEDEYITELQMFI